MPADNFMLSDLCCNLRKFLPILLDPISTRLRNRLAAIPLSRALFRLAISVRLSISIGPIISYLVGRLLSMSGVWVSCGMLCSFAVFLAGRGLRSTSHKIARPTKQQVQIVALIAVWIIIAVLSLADMQIGHRLYFSVIGLDYSVRTAFTNAISTSGLPAHSPFFFPGHFVGLRYQFSG